MRRRVVADGAAAVAKALSPDRAAEARKRRVEALVARTIPDFDFGPLRACGESITALAEELVGNDELRRTG